MLFYLLYLHCCVCITATAYGQGVYFAINSGYSVGYAAADSQGLRRMFQCRVLRGVTAVGTSSMLSPPPRPDGRLPCDSTTNNATNPIMFITYNDSQSYPDYLITFKV